MRSRAKTKARLFFCAVPSRMQAQRLSCPAPAAKGVGPISALLVKLMRAFISKPSDRGRSPRLRDFTRQRRPVQGSALAKVRTCVRRCAPFSKVRILEKPDVFFEDAQLFSKMRNFSCAPSRRARTGVSERPPAAPRRRKNRQLWAKTRQAERRNRDLIRDLFRHGDCRRLFCLQTGSQVARDSLAPYT
jgi:hypothetical protein